MAIIPTDFNYVARPPVEVSAIAGAMAHALNGKKCGPHSWRCICPFHNGSNPNFFISYAGDRVLVHCFAGCSQESVINELRARGLWPKKVKRRLRLETPYRRVEVEAPKPHKTAVDIWSLTTAAQDNHGYLVRKGIQPHGIGVLGSEFALAPPNVKRRGNLLVIPSYREGELTTLQFIAEDGTKGFLKGAPQSGVNFTFFGKPSVWIVEGFATGASLHEDTGDTVVVAFSAGQIKAVAAWACRAFPHQRVRIMADDDDAGHRSAIATGLEWRVPDFSGLDRGPKDNDYNDYVRLRNG